MGPGGLIEASDPRVRRYDFERQEVIDRSRVRRLQPVLEAMAHRIASVLGASMRQPVHVIIGATDQVTWEEHAASLPEPTFLAAATMLPLEGRMILHLPVALCLQLVDIYLGGDGRTSPDREKLTDIEHRLVADVADDIFSAVPPAFSAFIELTPGAIQKFSSPLFVQAGRPGEVCLRVELEVTFADSPPRPAHLSMPLTGVTPILEAFERLQRADGGDPGGPSPVLRDRLLGVPVEVSVGYPSVGLRPAELLELRPGDVIPIGQVDTEPDALLEVVVGGVLFGRGALVERGRRLACRLESRREETS